MQHKHSACTTSCITAKTTWLKMTTSEGYCSFRVHWMLPQNKIIISQPPHNSLTIHQTSKRWQGFIWGGAGISPLAATIFPTQKSWNWVWLLYFSIAIYTLLNLSRSSKCLSQIVSPQLKILGGLLVAYWLKHWTVHVDCKVQGSSPTSNRHLFLALSPTSKIE